MKQVVFVDSRWNSRGFFSTLNLLLLSLVWCNRNGVQADIGFSILGLYSDEEANHRKVRPFANYFGDAYAPHLNKSTEEMDIAWVYNNHHLEFEEESVIEEIRAINNDLLGRMVPRFREFVIGGPEAARERYDVAVHYRGCDYLKNTPEGHVPNLTPELFVAKLKSILGVGSKVFVATDDKRFIKEFEAAGYNPVYFEDVYRKGPGIGSHHKSFLQKHGLFSPVRQERKGYEVYRDCYWLSKGGLYVGSNSNLMYYSKILNPEQGQINLSVREFL